VWQGRWRVKYARLQKAAADVGGYAEVTVEKHMQSLIGKPA
jgi:hypothetical protein